MEIKITIGKLQKWSGKAAAYLFKFWVVLNILNWVLGERLASAEAPVFYLMLLCLCVYIWTTQKIKPIAKRIQDMVEGYGGETTERRRRER